MTRGHTWSGACIARGHTWSGDTNGQGAHDQGTHMVRGHA